MLQQTPTCLVSSRWLLWCRCVVYGGSCKTSPRCRFQNRLQCRFAWQAWRFVLVQHVSWRVKCQALFCVAGAMLWRCFQKTRCSFGDRRSTLETSDAILRGRPTAFDVSCCVFLPIALSGLRKVVTLTTPHSTLYTLDSTLYTPHFTLDTLQSQFHTSHSALYTPHFQLYTQHSTLSSLHSAPFTLHFTPHTLHSRLQNLHCTLHTLHLTLYTLQITINTLHFKL